MSPRRPRTPEISLPEAWSLARDKAGRTIKDHTQFCRGHGWMLDTEVINALAPVADYPNRENYLRLGPFGSKTAAELLERLPADYLAHERQNDGPTIGTVLRAIVRHPHDLRGFGYVITPERCDERVTLDGVLLRTDHQFTVCSAYEPEPAPNCNCEELYAILQQDFGVDDARFFPNELGYWYGSDRADRRHGDFWYRFWWD